MPTLKPFPRNIGTSANRPRIRSAFAAWILAVAGVVFGAFPAIPVSAEEPPKPPSLPDLAPPPPPPPPPPGAAGPGAEGDSTEPTVTIRYEGPTRIEEFSVNGRHYATRVTPAVGAPYLLVDPDGTGRLVRGDDTPSRRLPPQWTLFHFK